MSENTSQSSACGTAPVLIFPCSGAADVGDLADRAARKLTKDGTGKMFCLAGVGAHIDDMLATVKAAEKILAIDGCPKDCVRRTLEHAGVTHALHMRLTDLGHAKGASPATDERIAEVAAQAKAMLAQ